MDTNLGKMQHIGKFLDESSPNIANFLGPVIVGAGAGFISSYNPALPADAGKMQTVVHYISCPWMWILIGGAIAIWGIVCTRKEENKKNSTISTLEGKLREKEPLEQSLDKAYEQIENSGSRLRELQMNLVAEALKSASRTLGLTTHDRVSIYYELDDEFHLLSRYSRNPALRKNHRQKFPLDHGVLSQAWCHRVHLDKNCPDSNSNDYEEYQEKNYGYDAKTVSRFAMKSCRYLAFAITDADSPIGVILFESSNSNFLKATLKTKSQNIIMNFIAIFQTMSKQA